MTTLEEIYQELSAEFQSQTGLNAGSSSELAVRFYAVAAQLYSLYAQAEWTRRQCFPQTAQGEELDKHAQLRGVTRRQAVRAAGMVRFYVDEARTVDTEIPAGTICMTAGGVRFLTDRAGTVSAGELYADVPVTAAQAGADGNAAQGTVIYMAVPPVGVMACVNPAPLSGGQDEEEDETLRERVLETYRRLANGANSAFYQQAAMSFDGVAAATVLPRNRGIGTVDVIVAAQGGVPDEGLLAELQTYFDQVREIAVDVQVLPPQIEQTDLTVKLWVQQDREFDQVAGAVWETLRGWFTGRRLGSPLLRAELTALVFGVDGVANCTVVQPVSDWAASRTVLPVLGSLTVLNGGEGADGAGA